MLALHVVGRHPERERPRADDTVCLGVAHDVMRTHEVLPTTHIGRRDQIIHDVHRVLLAVRQTHRVAVHDGGDLDAVDDLAAELPLAQTRDLTRRLERLDDVAVGIDYIDGMRRQVDDLDMGAERGKAVLRLVMCP